MELCIEFVFPIALPTCVYRGCYYEIECGLLKEGGKGVI